MITLTKEEAQQVLDALEPIALYKAYNGDDWPARQVMPAIKTLRARIAEKEQEPMKQKTDLLFSTATMQDRHDAMLGRLEKTLERVKQEAQQKEQEPVAWNKSIRDSVDSLLAQAGFEPDSSVRHQLAMMNFESITVPLKNWRNAIPGGRYTDQ